MILSTSVLEAYSRARDAVEAANEISRNLIQDGEAVGYERFRDSVGYEFTDEQYEDAAALARLELVRLWINSEVVNYG